MPREHASESLLASVMKTPSKPASSAARAHSIIVGSGLSGIIEKASAILAMIVSFVGAIFPQAARSLDIVHRRSMATVVAAPIESIDHAGAKRGENAVIMSLRKACDGELVLLYTSD